MEAPVAIHRALRFESVAMGFGLDNVSCTDSDELTALQAVIRELCKQPKRISERQIIPENVLLRDCLRPGAIGLQFLEVLPTDVCNHKCQWCFTEANRFARILQPRYLRVQLDEFAMAGGVKEGIAKTSE